MTNDGGFLHELYNMLVFIDQRNAIIDELEALIDLPEARSTNFSMRTNRDHSSYVSLKSGLGYDLHAPVNGFLVGRDRMVMALGQ